MTLIIFRGLPGCGKSARAREMQAERGGRVVERDEIRYMLYGRYTDCDEKLVTNVQDRLIEEGLRMGENVFVSDMNLRNAYVTRLIKMAWQFGTDYEIVDMTDVPLGDCLAQNKTMSRIMQGKVVPEEVILNNHKKFIKGKGYPLPVLIEQDAVLEKQWTRYVPDLSKPTAVLWDVDGTLARMVDRGPFDEHLVLNDEVHTPVREMYMGAKARGHHNIVMSGRTDGCWEDTNTWVRRNVDAHFDPRDNTSNTHLFMRATGDQRSDDVVKHEIFHEKVAPFYNVLYVVDDRNKVVKMWREIGLTCAQVAEGDF